MKIIPLPAFQDNYIWTFLNPENQSIMVVDPGLAEPVIHFLTEHHYKLDAVLLTHHHPDHIAGVSDLLSLYPELKIYGPNDSRIPKLTQRLTSGDTVTLDPLQLEFEVIATPGHTTSHICYYSPSEILLCGDTLFASGCGRLFEGTPQQMFDSLQRLSQLPANTKVYCGHEYTLKNLEFAKSVEPNNEHIYNKLNIVRQLRSKNQVTLPSTIEQELQTNPFLRVHNQQVIEFGRVNGAENDDPVTIFQVLRHCKDHF